MSQRKKRLPCSESQSEKSRPPGLALEPIPSGFEAEPSVESKYDARINDVKTELKPAIDLDEATKPDEHLLQADTKVLRMIGTY